MTVAPPAASVDLGRFGIVVGHATDRDGGTGLTVVRGIDAPLRSGVAVFGRATGSRELRTASPDHVAGGRVDAILLTGGSAYGLDAAAGVMRWMEERGRGFSVGAGVVPIVPAGVVFDLMPVGRFDARPTPAMAYAACESATTTIEEGSVGAGTGVTVGKVFGGAGAMKSGVGCAMAQAGSGVLSVAALAVVNAFGDVRDARGAILAGARDEQGRFADTARVLRRGGPAAPKAFEDVAIRNTTLAVVATSAPLDAGRLGQLAHAAGAALFARITPTGTSFDGDMIFAVSPERGEFAAVEPVVVEALAVEALSGAIERAVTLAHGRDGIPGYADTHGHANTHGRS